MGWFSKVKNFASRAVGAVGGVVKKVGHFVAPIARKVGEWAPAVGNVAGYGLDVLGGVTGQPELIAAGEAVRRGSNWLSGIAHKGADISQRVGDVGGQAAALAEKYR